MNNIFLNNATLLDVANNNSYLKETTNGDAFFSLLIYFLFIGLALILLASWKLGKTKTIIVSLALGFTMFFALLIVHNTTNVNPTQIDSVKNWYKWIGVIFIYLVVLIIPFYIFFITLSFILSDSVTNVRGATYLTSFGSLLALSLFGIIVALAMIPLIYAIPNDWLNITEPGDWVETGGEEGGGFISYFTKWWLILALVILSIFIGLLARLTLNKNKGAYLVLKKTTDRISGVIGEYYKIVVLLVPFVIFTRLTMIGLEEENIDSNLGLMGSYLIIFWIGSLFIFGFLYILNILLSNKNISRSEKSKILVDQVAEVFATQSTQASLPMTQDTVRKLGVSDDVSKITPTKGTIMGMVMCNGFSPMLIVLFSIANANGGSIDWVKVIFAVVLVTSFAISTSGQGSADYVITTSVLGILNISTYLYLGVLMPVQEINEKTIRTPNNTLGHIAATQITDKVHRRSMIKNNTRAKIEISLD